MTGATGERFGYRPELDGIRGIASVLAFWWHAWILGLTDHLGGHGGVDAFFVLSGYLITSVLLDAHASKGKISLKTFYVRRALRLLPALFIMLLLGWWATTLFPDQEYPYIKQAGFTLAYMANWIFDSLGVLSHTWTLALEEQYYLLWPITLIIAMRAGISRRKLAIGSIVIAVIIGLLRALAFGRVHGVMFNVYNTYGRIDGLFIGNAIALAPEMWRWARRRSVAVTALIILVFTLAIQVTLEPGFEAPEPYQRGLFTLIGFCSAAIIAHAHWKRDGVGVRLLRIRPLPYIGRISYGVYLYHVPVFVLVAQLKLSVAPAIAVGIAATYVFAGLSYALVEERFLRLKSRLAPRSSKDTNEVTTPT